METVAQICTAGGIIGLVAMMLKWTWARITRMEKKHCGALYTANHQPIYVTEERCDHIKDEFVVKVDEIKALIIEMDRKRESAKDQFVEGQLKIESRLTAIETSLKVEKP